MKRLLLISALLLFASNGWAEQVCSIDVEDGDDIVDIFFDIEMNCEDTEILWVEFEPLNYPKTDVIDRIVASFCDFDKQILIREKVEIVGVEYPRIQCHLFNHLRRTYKPKVSLYNDLEELRKERKDGE